MFQFFFRAFFATLVIGYPNPLEAYKTDVSQPIVGNSSQNKPEKPKLGECFEEGKRVPCFSYETFKVKHGLPSEITRVLRCLFNAECSQKQSTESSRQNNLSSAKISSDLDYSENSFEDASRVANSSSRTIRKRNYKQTIGRPPSDGSATNPDSYKNLDLEADLSSTEKKDNLYRKETLFWPDDHNSLIFVRDPSGRIGAIKKVIASLDRSESQVRIESRIVRANRDWSRGMGILWGGRNNQFGGVKTDRSSYWGITGNQAGAPANTATGANLKQTIFLKGVQQPVSRTITSSEIPSRLAVNLPASVANLGDVMGLGLQFGLLANQYITELDFRLQIGEAQGQAKTVARPSIQVSDGRNAVIKSGSVLNVQTSSPQWGTNSQLVSVDLKLQVTPKILPDGRIRMVITVTDNEPNPFPTTGELYLAREAHTTMTVANGETCVIGGIIRETVIGRREGWPGLMNIPLLGMLFSNRSNAKETDELLVFISPNVIFKGN
jgi:type IV pilus assembly protein PilQ